MFCPMCGTSNSSTSKFCGKCGAPLPVQPAGAVPQGQAGGPPPPQYGGTSPQYGGAQPQAYRAPVAAIPHASRANVGGLLGIGCGIAVLVAWFLPWIGLGSGFGTGGLLGGFGGLGFGSAAQIAYYGVSLGGNLLGNNNFYGGAANPGYGIIAIAIAFVLVLFPLQGLLCLIGGARVYALRNDPSQQATFQLGHLLSQNRNRAIGGLFLVVVIFVCLALFSNAVLSGTYGYGFGLSLTSLLGGGYYVTGIAFAVLLVGLLVNKS